MPFPDDAGAIPTRIVDDKRRSLTAAQRARRLSTRENQVTPPPEGGDRRDHFWACWGEEKGPGALFRTEVLGKLDALTKRSWYQAGGAAVVGLVAMAFLAAWLSGKFEATELKAVTRQDVEVAIKKSVEMATAKIGDDQVLLQRKFDKAQVQQPLPVEATAKARK